MSDIRPDCKVPDCPNPHHSNGLCDRHMKAWRRAIEKNPEVPAVELRPDRRPQREYEEWIEDSLSGWCSAFEFRGQLAPWKYTSEPASGGPRITGWVDHQEIREDWEEYREHLMGKVEAGAGGPVGSRPWAWWLLEAERPEHLSYYPSRNDNPDMSEVEHGRQIDLYRREPIEYLAMQGHLFPWEIDQIRRDAIEAAPRIGTGDEMRSSTIADSRDRTAVRLALDVDTHLEVLHGDKGRDPDCYGWGDGVPYEEGE
jgi:hypothetical protein